MKDGIKSWRGKKKKREKAESREFITSGGLGAVEVLNEGCGGHPESNMKRVAAPWAIFPCNSRCFGGSKRSSWLHVQVVLSFPLPLAPGFQRRVRVAWQEEAHMKMVLFVSTRGDLVLLKFIQFFFFLLEFGTENWHPTSKCLSDNLCVRICEAVFNAGKATCAVCSKLHAQNGLVSAGALQKKGEILPRLWNLCKGIEF